MSSKSSLALARSGPTCPCSGSTSRTSPSDAELFLNMLAASSEGQEVDIESIVQGCMRMKGSASSLDVQNLIFITKIIHKRQKRFEKEVRRRLRTLSQLQDRTAAVIDGLGLEVDADDAADGEASDHPIGHWQGSETPRSPRSRATSKISAGAAEPQR
ncbi:unnamed protein product [Prorocentrum cordatum]|uniref:Uncharacterized protein n=1 Tax=Prorocentrum cordatum TaxID=2364126 RepID=A0ABN9Y1X7_9DINO|nr:unnamed protein product [Polarella glacialis]